MLPFLECVMWSVNLCYIFICVERALVFLLLIFLDVERALVFTYISSHVEYTLVFCAMFLNEWNALWYIVLYVLECVMRSGIVCYPFPSVERALVFCVVLICVWNAICYFLIYFFSFFLILCCIILTLISFDFFLSACSKLSLI